MQRNPHNPASPSMLRKPCTVVEAPVSLLNNIPPRPPGHYRAGLAALMKTFFRVAGSGGIEPPVPFPPVGRRAISIAGGPHPVQVVSRPSPGIIPLTDCFSVA